ncbi:IFIT3, partial [Cervus elaphus hippelaphus]
YCEITTHSLENIFLQLKCHFTWNVCGEESSLDDLEDRGYDQVEFLNKEFKAITYNLFACIKHCRGQHQVALEYLEQAEDFIMHRRDHQGKTGHLALEKKPSNPEFSLGLLITLYRLHDKAPAENTIHLLRQATKLEPDKWYLTFSWL